MKKQGKQKKKKEFPNEYSVTLKIFLAYKFNKNRWQSLFKKKKTLEKSSIPDSIVVRKKKTKEKKGKMYRHT